MKALLENKLVIPKIRQNWKGGSNNLPLCAKVKDRASASLRVFP